jgi:hypothetical protein
MKMFFDPSKGEHVPVKKSDGDTPDKSPFKKKSKDKPKEQEVLGALEAFGSLIFTVNTGDQAENYIRTFEKLSEYSLMTYGKDMRNLVKYGKEKTFTEPAFPSSELRSADRLHEVKYKEELAKYNRDKDKYDEQKTFVFGIIIGQCSPMVQDRLNADPAFAQVEMDSDVVKLLKMLHAMSHSTMGKQEPNWALVTVLRRLLTMQQQKHDTVNNYYLRFKSNAAVLQAQWGAFYPPHMVSSTDEDVIAKASEAIITSIFLANSDNSRFRSLKERLNNDFLGGKDNYPKTLDKAVDLLTYNQDHSNRALQSIVAKSIGAGFEASFAQKGKNGSGKPATNDDDEDSKKKKKSTRKSNSSPEDVSWTM